MSTGRATEGPNRRRVVARLVSLLLLGLLLSLTGCGGGQATGANGARCAPERPRSLQPRVLRRIPHDRTSYTQGLVWHGDPTVADGDGVLFESSGLYGESRLAKVDLANGTVLDSVALDARFFGEGLALVDGSELVQLTWKEHTALRWDAAGFTSGSEPRGRFSYRGEGWGLTTLADGRLLMSDGSDQLVERDPRTFAVLAKHRVRRLGGASDLLNELEWDGRAIWANRYQSDEILRIEPRCWTVTGVVDASAIVEEVRTEAARAHQQVDVLNGIAYDVVSGHYYVTGKWWPTLFEVTFA